MTVFEDLIVELKKEDLLEDTVLSQGDPNGGASGNRSSEEHDFGEIIDTDTSGRASIGTPSTDKVYARRDDAAGYESPDEMAEQISTLKTVDHVLATIERTTCGKDLSGFDELRATKALHVFQQAAADSSSSEFAIAQSELIEQVSSWKETLSTRHDQISVATLRRYCETCQPALSAQALFSIARFVRSLPYSESCRGKYEFVVTRLFSKQLDGEKRTAICGREEMLGHLRARFVESKGHVSASQAESADRMILAIGLDDIAAEADKAQILKELLDSDYFSRLYKLKQQAKTAFFTPEVTAASILCNIKVLNKVVSLTLAEYKSSGAEAFVRKFGSSYDEAISNSIGRSVELASLVTEIPVEADEVSRPARPDRIDDELIEKKRDTRSRRDVIERKPKSTFIGPIANVNRWLLATTIIVVILSVGLYLWVNYSSDTAAAMTKDVKVVDIASSEFKDLIKEGRISGDTFYGITLPGWDDLTRESQQEALTKVYKSLTEKGCRRVSLINQKGQTVGSAVEGRADVFRP